MYSMFRIISVLGRRCVGDAKLCVFPCTHASDCAAGVDTVFVHSSQQVHSADGPYYVSWLPLYSSLLVSLLHLNSLPHRENGWITEMRNSIILTQIESQTSMLPW